MEVEKRSEIADAPPQGSNGVWDFGGRRIVAWRNWGLFGAGTYSRGSGEGLWTSDQHRLVFSLTPLPPMLLWIDGGPCRDVRPIPDAVTFYPAGVPVRTAGEDSRYAQVCWSPDLYRTIAPELPAPPDLEPAVTFQDPLLSQLARSLAEEIGQGPLERLLAESLVTALAMRAATRRSVRPGRVGRDRSCCASAEAVSRGACEAEQVSDRALRPARRRQGVESRQISTGRARLEAPVIRCAMRKLAA